MPDRSHQAAQLGEGIADRAVRALFGRFVERLTDINGGISLDVSNIEFRAYYGEHLLCRVVPYRELFHVQVGDTPAWEIRVKSETGLSDTIDRILMRFLHLISSQDGGG